MENYEKIGSNLSEREVWQRLIVKWRTLMYDYIERYNTKEGIDEEEKDLPYWYDERTNGGFLAGAVWSLGGSVLEEFPVDRDSGSDKSKGRCDFWIGIDSLMCYLEAKKIPSYRAEETIAQIEDALNKAKAQLEQIKDCKVGIAICFVVPQLKEPITKSSAQEEARRIFNGIEEKFNTENNIVATYFSPDNAQFEDLKYGGYYPGVALVGELITVAQNKPKGG